MRLKSLLLRRHSLAIPPLARSAVPNRILLVGLRATGIPQTRHMLVSLPTGYEALRLLEQFGIKLPIKEIVAADGEILERFYCSAERPIQGVWHLVAPGSHGLYRYASKLVRHAASYRN